jgi:hypothetical protein
LKGLLVAEHTLASCLNGIAPTLAKMALARQLEEDSNERFTIAGQVSINLQDGSMKFEPGYSPDAAARQLWEAISQDYRDMLRWKAEHRTISSDALIALGVRPAGCAGDRLSLHGSMRRCLAEPCTYPKCVQK